MPPILVEGFAISLPGRVRILRFSRPNIGLLEVESQRFFLFSFPAPGRYGYIPLPDCSRIGRKPSLNAPSNPLGKDAPQSQTETRRPPFQNRPFQFYLTRGKHMYSFWAEGGGITGFPD
jgi:hypothetical protein